MRLTRIVLLLMFLCCNAVVICAQSGPSSGMVASPTPTPTASSTSADDFAADELKTQQQIIAELRFLRKDNAEKAKQIVALEGEVKVSTRIIGIEIERGDFFKVAAEKGIKTGDNCGLLQEKYDRMVATHQAEIVRLAAENTSLRESRKWRTVVSGAAGAGFGYYFGQQVCNR